MTIKRGWADGPNAGYLHRLPRLLPLQGATQEAPCHDARHPSLTLATSPSVYRTYFGRRKNWSHSLWAQINRLFDHYEIPKGPDTGPPAC